MTSSGIGPRTRSVLVPVALVVLGGTLAIACDTDGPPERVSGRATTGAADLGGALDGSGLDDDRRTGGRCRGVAIATDADPHRVLRAHRPGTTFCLQPGVHRIERPLRPQEGDTIAGRPGAVLSGAKVLTGWTAVDRGWTTSGHLPDEPSEYGECLPEQPDCTFAEDVFLDGRRLVRVASAAQVTSDTFFADYSTNTITLGTDPGGRLVEQAVAPALVRSGHSGVTVRGLVLEMAANEAQVAAVDSRRTFPRAGAGWRVLHNDVRLNHAIGVGIASRGRVRGNLIREQGQLGVAVWGEDVQVRRNEIARNGLVGYDPEWEAGGVKSWMTTSTLLAENYVHHNLGPGLWSDGGCDGTVYRRNLITDNWGPGIQHEISYDALVVRNRVVRNGLQRKGWAWGAGIQIQSSGGRRVIDVRRNVVSDSTHGIVVIDSADRRTEVPHPSGPHIVQNVLIRRNVVTMRPGQWTGLFHDHGNHAVFSRGIRFVGNTYRLDSLDQRSFGWEDELLTWAQWRARGGPRQDRGGTAVVGAR